MLDITKAQTKFKRFINGLERVSFLFCIIDFFCVSVTIQDIHIMDGYMNRRWTGVFEGTRRIISL